jgi:hypothetical protein
MSYLAEVIAERDEIMLALRCETCTGSLPGWQRSFDLHRHPSGSLVSRVRCCLWTWRARHRGATLDSGEAGTAIEAMRAVESVLAGATP